MRKTLLKWLILTLLLIYAGWVAVWAGGEAERHTCAGIEVRVESNLLSDSTTQAGVLAHLGAYEGKIKGIPTHRINTQAIEDYLSHLSNFETVECVITSDHFLRIDIVPMRPEVRIFDSKGSYYINRTGKRIDSNANFFVDVPVVKGEFTENFPATTVLPLTRFIASDPFMSQLVAMIEAKDADNLLLVPRIHGHLINFGDTTRLAEKRDALKAMYRKVLPYKGWETYDTISVRFRGQVVATRRDKKPLIHSATYVEEYDPEEATLPTDDDNTPSTTTTGTTPAGSPKPKAESAVAQAKGSKGTSTPTGTPDTSTPTTTQSSAP
ncbi:MAG: hypothetical protein K2H47_04720 [Muribaculaceae bacterium]|nr:hypothetical protein [Muribaculaceae bacterium]